MPSYEAKRGNAVKVEAGAAAKAVFETMKHHFNCFMFVGWNKDNPNNRVFSAWGENGIDYLLSVFNSVLLMSGVFENVTPEELLDGVKEMLAIGKLPAGSEEAKTRSEALMRKFGKVKIPEDAKEIKDGDANE